ncbi:MAG: hypothetical protein NZ811_08895 [Gammaproteobacteria bacterium]|nr:hypothetical protein [Gammaproteobacteria bacterium]
MKKQLLIAAVAASMTSLAVADISLSGRTLLYGDEDHSSYAVNNVVIYKDKLIEAGATLTGKSGGTSVVAQIGLDNANAVEQLYATSSVAGNKVTFKTMDMLAAAGRKLASGTTFGATYTKASGAMGGIDVSVEGIYISTEVLA